MDGHVASYSDAGGLAALDAQLPKPYIHSSGSLTLPNFRSNSSTCLSTITGA